MAIQSKTVEVSAYTGQAVGYAFARTGGGGTGVASSVTVAESPADSEVYIVTVNWDDTDSSNEPLGYWMVGVGTVAVSAGAGAIVFNATDTNYMIGSLTKAQAQAAVVAGITQAGVAISVVSPVASSTTIELINHDHYDGTAAALLAFTVGKDYTAATSVELVIFKKDTPATVYKTATAIVASSTNITVDVDVDFGSSLTFSGCPLVAQCGFALVATWTAEEETITRGIAYVYDRGEPV